MAGIDKLNVVKHLPLPKDLGLPRAAAIAGFVDGAFIRPGFPGHPAGVRIDEPGRRQVVDDCIVLRLPGVTAVGGFQNQAVVGHHPAGLSIDKAHGIELL